MSFLRRLKRKFWPAWIAEAQPDDSEQGVKFTFEAPSDLVAEYRAVELLAWAVAQNR